MRNCSRRVRAAKALDLIPESCGKVTVGCSEVAGIVQAVIDSSARLRDEHAELQDTVRELEREIAKETVKIAGGSGSLSANSARFQELQLASQFAEQQLTIALSSLQEARADARRKQAYIERVAEPSLPDHATAPRRFRGILATLLLGLLAWGVLSMLLVGIREHRE